MSERYDRIGKGYRSRRLPDPRIFACIRRQLQSMTSVLNVGSGTGSYEPEDLAVFAVEPSAIMISQRKNRRNAVQARAESLPFSDNAVDAAMAILTVHHWEHQKKGLEECARVARKRIMILTWDPESDGFWLVNEYFPELLAFDRRVFPGMEAIRRILGPLDIRPLPIPADCVDGFLGAYWRRPHAYLNETIRSCMSSFSRIENIDTRLAELRRDIVSGAWQRRHRHLLSADALDIGYRLVTSKLH